MAESRQVTCTGKTPERTIASLGSRGAYWSPRRKADAVSDIEAGSAQYWVSVGGARVDVRVTYDGHLSTSPDKTIRNNLLELTDC